MNKIYSTQTDLKLRFAGILENPYVSKVHRHCLDGFKVKGLANILKPIHFENLLDVGCGLGEYACLKKGRYVGLDNSFVRVSFAKQQYRNCHFVQGDAVRLPFLNKTFEAVLLANTAHHLSDKLFEEVLGEMKRVSSKYIIIDDCVRTPDQGRVSRYFYSLDRGTQFRMVEGFKNILSGATDLNLVKEDTHRTFPGLYLHAVFVLELKT